MLISVVTDGGELSNYAVGKILNSASKSWNAKVLLFFLKTGRGESYSVFQDRIKGRAVEAGIEVEFETLDGDLEAGKAAKKICTLAEAKGVTGIFIPESMSQIYDNLKEQCTEIPVETVSSDLFPSIWDIMTKRVATVNIKDTMSFAANVMVEKRIGSLLVMDRGRLTGILTEHDFVKAYAAGNDDGKKVKDAMSHPVVTLDRSGTIFEACELMKKHRIKKLVIMEGGQLKGIITTTDLAKLPLNISEGLNYLVSKIKELSL